MFPRTIYLKDYTLPPYLISNTELDVALTPSQTTREGQAFAPPKVQMRRRSRSSLTVNSWRLLRVTLDGQELPASKYVLTDKGL